MEIGFRRQMYLRNDYILLNFGERNRPPGGRSERSRGNGEGAESAMIMIAEDAVA